jgi:hypothetical protein
MYVNKGPGTHPVIRKAPHGRRPCACRAVVAHRAEALLEPVGSSPLSFPDGIRRTRSSSDSSKRSRTSSTRVSLGATRWHVLSLLGSQFHPGKRPRRAGDVFNSDNAIPRICRVLFVLEDDTELGPDPQLVDRAKPLATSCQRWQTAAKQAFRWTLTCHQRSTDAISSFQIPSTIGRDRAFILRRSSLRGQLDAVAIWRLNQSARLNA